MTWPAEHDVAAQRDLEVMVPEGLRYGISEYIEHGRLSGDFLNAVYRGDLYGAAQRADMINRHHLRDIALFLIWHAPSTSIGSPERVEAWVEGGGLTRAPLPQSVPEG